jgi:hypothetical protein
MTSHRNRVLRGLGVIGLLIWLVAFIRAAFLSGPNWLVEVLLVAGAVFLLAAIILWWFWKDSKG